MKTKVSILTNNYNGSRFLPKFFESLYSQTFKEWTLIFYDNCSNDNSLSLVEKFQKKDSRINIFISNHHTGLGLARHNALKKCNSEFVAIWDVDDLSHKKRLEYQYNYLVINKNISLLTSNVVKFNEKLNKSYYTVNSPKKLKISLKWKNIIVHSSIMFRRLDAIKIGGYNPKYNYSQDYNFYIKFLINNFKLASIDKFLCYQYINKKGLSFKLDMKKTIINDQINNLIEARKIKNVNLIYTFLNYLSLWYYKFRLIIAK